MATNACSKGSTLRLPKVVANPVVNYESEIRDYLVGRLASDRTVGAARGSVASLSTRRLLGWWIFEGKRYGSLRQPLAFEWHTIEHQIQRLMASHSPHWRPLECPEGEVDWLATAHHAATSQQPEYICRTSRLGLSADEAAALAGWCGWIARRWNEHITTLDPLPGAPRCLPWAPAEEEAGVGILKRWALVSRRSRWPLLRCVISESLRLVLEPDVLDQLPLPSDGPTLFELVCLVRILRVLEPEPRGIRWLDSESTQNTIRVPGVAALFQHAIPREEMLDSLEFDGGLRDAMVRHQVRTPGRMDALLVFDHPRNGFHGILLEAKSGLQDPSATIFQLKCYRAAIRRWLAGRLIIWGIVEHGSQVGQNDDLPVREDGDLWVFSPVDAVEGVARRLLSSG